jgi:glycosyltransferase involved in cell wall biosynthesis
MRVLWLIKGLGPGGAEQLLVNQARAAAGDVSYHAAYLVPWKDHLVGDLEAAGVAVTCLEAPREVDLRWTIRLRALIERERIDVVHVHSPYVAAATRVLVRTLPRRRRPALVYTEHNEWPRHARLTRSANRATIGLDDHDLAVSDEVRASMPPSVASRVEVLLHGIDVERVRSASVHREDVRRELGVPDDVVVVGIVANFRPEKAYDDWLDAAALVPASLPVRFVSVGQGPLEEVMRDRVRTRGLDDRVTLLGYRDDAVRVMAGFDLFTLSSVHEGLPVSLMDALALGLPVVATTAGGIPRAVTDGVEGCLVPPRQPRRLAEAIGDLAADAERRAAMGKAAAVRAEAFDIERAAARLEEIYVAVARARRRS